MENGSTEKVTESILSAVAKENDIFEDVSAAETVTFDINITQLRGKARLSVNAPLGLETDAIDYVKSECVDRVDKRYATKTGRKVGELRIRGDGTIIQAEIEDEFEK